MLLIRLIIIWFLFWTNRNKLPKHSNIKNPKYTYESLSCSFIWEDEGLWGNPHRYASFFKHVIAHRSEIQSGNTDNIRWFSQRFYDKVVYKMAKFYFPDWIGFSPSRCTYNAELADRLERIFKVVEWRINKMD